MLTPAHTGTQCIPASSSPRPNSWSACWIALLFGGRIPTGNQNVSDVSQQRSANRADSKILFCSTDWVTEMTDGSARENSAVSSCCLHRPCFFFSLRGLCHEIESSVRARTADTFDVQLTGTLWNSDQQEPSRFHQFAWHLLRHRFETETPEQEKQPENRIFCCAV